MQIEVCFTWSVFPDSINDTFFTDSKISGDTKNGSGSMKKKTEEGMFGPAIILKAIIDNIHTEYAP